MNPHHHDFPQHLANGLHNADAIAWMKNLPDNSVDFVLTDPPYVQRYSDRDGRRIANDDNTAWIEPAFAQIFRVVRPNRFFVCWYSWRQAERFFAAWRRAGFRTVGHFVAPKPYTSGRGVVEHRHEQACLLAKGTMAQPFRQISDVLPWRYTRNIWHPTQKPLCALEPLIVAFTQPGELVLDPFAGSASTLVAAYFNNRHFCGIELDEHYFALATRRLHRMTRFKRAAAALRRERPPARTLEEGQWC